MGARIEHGWKTGRLCGSTLLLMACGGTGTGMQPDASTLADASTHEDAATPARASAGCTGAVRYAAGTHADSLDHDGLTRTFRVHVPPGPAPAEPRPVVMMFHGGGGSGRQFQEASSRMDAVADREGFITVYPDGTGVLRAWNGGGCCAAAMQNDVDDVGFVNALLDRLESALCLDSRRVYASGLSNGAMLSHRLACELSDRIAAVAPVAGTNMASTCAPKRKIPVLQIHGSADGHVPWDGGGGCGLAGVAFTSVPSTISGWSAHNGCDTDTRTWLDEGDGHCEELLGCDEASTVVLCRIEGGGHNWPGGDPPAGLVECPGNGGQSTVFSASEIVWRFLRAHALP